MKRQDIREGRWKNGSLNWSMDCEGYVEGGSLENWVHKDRAVMANFRIIWLLHSD